MLHPRDVLFVHKVEARRLHQEAEFERLIHSLTRRRMRTAIVQFGCRLPVLRSTPACALSPTS